MLPYENGRGCPKCRFAPNGCPSGCHINPYHVLKGERLTPERKAILHQERKQKSSGSAPRTLPSPAPPPPHSGHARVQEIEESTMRLGETWTHKGTEIRDVSVKSREDGSHVRTVCIKKGAKKPRFRYLCNSDINHRKTQYGFLGYAQVSSCSCFHCYSHYMGRQWSNDLRTKISNAIRHGKHYDKYEPLIGISRNELIIRLMERMRMRYGLAYSAVTWDEIVSGRYKFQIDEIIPRQVFYIEKHINDVDEWTRIFNQKNFQLLTKEDNDAKGARIENIADFHIFNSIFPLEGARRVIIDSRLNWIDRRMKRKLELLDSEKEFFVIHDRSSFH